MEKAGAVAPAFFYPSQSMVNGEKWLDAAGYNTGAQHMKPRRRGFPVQFLIIIFPEVRITKRKE
jgi:hypothetical protein